MSDCIYRTVEYVELHQGEVLGLRNSVISLAFKENSKHLPRIHQKVLQTPSSTAEVKEDSPSSNVNIDNNKNDNDKEEEKQQEQPPKDVSETKTEPSSSTETNTPQPSTPPTQEKQTLAPPQEPELEHHSSALTPHDMFILYKSKSITVPQQDSEMESYFHYCIGLDTSSPISISTYILKLLEKQQPPGWLEYYKYKVFKACFCCYNFFSHCDVRVEFHFPGGVSSYLIDQDGKRVEEVSDLIWKEAAVCSYLRCLEFSSIHSSLSLAHLSRCVKLLPFQDYLSLEQEESHLQFAIDVIAKKSQHVQSFQLATHIFNYLKSFGRIQLAHKLFAPLSQIDPSYLPFMSHIYSLQKDVKESSAIWANTAAIYSDNYVMIVEYLKYSTEQLYKKRRSEKSVSSEQTLLLDSIRWCLDQLSKFQPKTIQALCCEAQSYVMLGDYQKALSCLQQVPRKSVELLVMKPFNFPKKIANETNPPMADFVHPKWCDLDLAEKGFFFGNELSGVDETVASKELEPLIVSVGTHSIFNDPIKHEMYSILVQMYHLIGWDQFRTQWEQFREKVNPVSETLSLLHDALALDLKLLGKWTIEEDSPSTAEQSHPQYTSMDWFLRASLAHRLQLFNFSLLAFRKSVARADNTRSLVALLDHYTQKLVQNVSHYEKLDKTSATYTKQVQEYQTMQDKLLVDTLGFVEKLFGYYLSDKTCPAEDKDREAYRYLHVHPKCMQALFHCVGVFGLQHVLKKVKALHHSYREHFYNYLFLGVGWNIIGFEK